MLELTDILESTFPVTDSRSEAGFRFFPICNEYGFAQIVDDLTVMPSTKNAAQIKVALLFGESHFLSLLPSLAPLVDVIILADIENRLHKHNRHLLATFQKSATISTFLQNYCIDFPADYFNPSDGLSFRTIHIQMDILFGKKSRASLSLKNHHFLSTIAQYQACKTALQQVAFVQIKLNLIDRFACKTLAEILHQYHAQLSVCNFTNIHQFVDNELLRVSIRDLFSNASPEFIMYSTGTTDNLRVQSTNEIENYWNAEMTKKSTIAHQGRLFEGIKKENKPYNKMTSRRIPGFGV